MVVPLNTDWLNENALRLYPFVDGSSKETSDGLILDNGLIVDISLPVPIGLIEPKNVFVQKIVGFDTGIAIALADRTDPYVTIASTTVFVDSHSEFESYTLTGQGELLGIIGRITLGDPLTISSAAKNIYNFETNPAATQLVASAIRPYLRGLSGIKVVDSTTAESYTLTGNVVIDAGQNITFDVSSGQLKINSGLVAPSDLEQDCGCTDSEGAEGMNGLGEPIYTINGVEPDADGNIDIRGYECTEIETFNHTLVIDDICSEPCCSCEQLAVLYQSLQAVENESGGLNMAVQQLHSRLSNMQNVIANSQLNPPGGGQEPDTYNTSWFLPIGPGGYGGVWVDADY